MINDLKSKTITGIMWSAVQRFGGLVISFIANLFFARLLSPEDFGCIGMLMVFIAIANTFIDGGFGSALIQKKEPTEEDYSTVFYWNLTLSFALFIVLFWCAPAIAKFYKIPLLSDVLRVQGLMLILYAFCIIQNTRLIRQLNFKLLAKINVIASVIGALIGVTLAYIGFGVWSLVVKMLTITFLQMIFLWICVKWKPLWIFSWESFKGLFSYGGLMLVSSIVETVYTNIQSLIIGRFFSARDLGFYTQAQKLEEIPAMSLSNIVNQVTFPVFSQLQDDKERLKVGMRKSLKSISFLNFPLMVLLIIVAQPLFTLLFTNKWDESVPYFQVLCLYAMLLTANSVNINLFKAMGKSNVYLAVQLTKRVIGVICIIIGLRFGIMGMMWAIVLTGYLSFLINAFVAGRLIDYGIIEQVKDVASSYLLSIIIGGIVFYLTYFVHINYIALLFIQVLFYALLYMGISHLLRVEGYSVYREVILSKIKENKYDR